jgi:hypothetical protein
MPGEGRDVLEQPNNEFRPRWRCRIAESKAATAETPVHTPRDAPHLQHQLSTILLARWPGADVCTSNGVVKLARREPTGSDGMADCRIFVDFGVLHSTCREAWRYLRTSQDFLAGLELVRGCFACHWLQRLRWI